MRLRWYGHQPMPTYKCVLEIKNKKTELGWKDSFPISNITIANKVELLSAITSIGMTQGNLIPTLHNTYRRSYYISQNGLFRITIDSQQTFKIPFSNMSSLQIHHPFIIELKYDQHHAHRASEITDYLPFRQTKNSKYANGIQELYF